MNIKESKQPKILKDLFGNNLILNKEYVYYTDSNSFTSVTYGKHINSTDKGYATLLVTRKKSFSYLGEPKQYLIDGLSKVSVKPFKLVPNVY